MRYDDFNKIIRFSYFFPYGIIGRSALELAIPAVDNAFIDYSPTISMEERLESCRLGHRNRLAALQVMEKYGYIEQVRRKIGPKQKDYVVLLRLTRSGLNLMTGYDDSDLEYNRIEAAGMLDQWRTPVSYLPVGTYEETIRDNINNLAKKLPDAELQFNELVDWAIQAGYVSPLALGLTQSNDVKLTPQYSYNALYRNWCLSNIQALFKANQFLTNIDRVPLIPDAERKGLHEFDVEEFSRSILKRWYGQHPSSYTFNSPKEDPSEEAYQAWLSTPAFYPVSEIPGFAVAEDPDRPNDVSNNDYTFNRTFIGLAAGQKANYLVYYGKIKPNRWNIKTEYETIKKMEYELERAEGPDGWENPHKDKNCNYGLYVCHSPLHFHALYKDAKKRMGQRKKDNRNVAAPFGSYHIVPLNHAGVAEIRMLMSMNPRDVDNLFVYNYSDRYDGFEENPYDNTYRLTFNGVRVLLAHTMDFQKLFNAAEDYERGEKFVVSCFPQQVPYIRQIMPDVEFI